MKSSKGFTLIELLVVIAVIGLLASVILASLSTARDKARVSKMKQEVAQIATAVLAAQANGYTTLINITGTGCTACITPQDTALQTSLQTLVTKSGLGNLDQIIRDPWGNVYALDENEGESGTTDCRRDSITSTGHGVYYFEYYTQYCKSNPTSTTGWH